MKRFYGPFPLFKTKVIKMLDKQMANNLTKMFQNTAHNVLLCMWQYLDDNCKS